MWLFGFSTKHPRNMWIIGAISLVILVITALRRYFMHLDHKKTSDDGDHRCSTAVQVTGRVVEQEAVVTKWCPGVIRTYALEELKMATRDFRIRIGVGATSFVYLADLGDGRFGAVKRVMEDRGGSKKIFLDEVSVLLRISHPNLARLMGFCLEKGEQLLLLEYVPNKTLFDRIHTYHGQSSGILSWSSRLSIALDIARALDYLHSRADPTIIHRDVKSSNILLVDDDHAKLADFGLCKLGYDRPDSETSTTPSTSPTSIKGSFGYIDINYLNTGLATPKIDVYSYGVLLLELITGLKSIQGSVTLAEWTEEWRKSDDVEVWANLLDPKLNGNANLEQLSVLIHVANFSLLENSEGRPEMGEIVDRIRSCMEPQPNPHLLSV
ncbi:hypothetical protein POPTR_004G235700v4 [Populus trichocarpa]|uniref:Uncharacterized protein n=1 Tax=Populus trichocarpa TaxID=3694 RepID=A0ACC0T704_POPTR|nr:pto-interacting protein 1 [Populus trichocarpa]KAI9397123.1 hypothetical protein POPTR_004G235700v4 [Populus trichocarpa]